VQAAITEPGRRPTWKQSLPLVELDELAEQLELPTARGVRSRDELIAALEEGALRDADPPS
jgi:hypothetical protein